MNTYQNPRIRAIQVNAIARSNKPLNKYNTGMHMNTEELVEESNDRTAYDVGTEQEIKQTHD